MNNNMLVMDKRCKVLMGAFSKSTNNVLIFYACQQQAGPDELIMSK